MEHQTKTFLSELWPDDVPPGGSIQMWRLSDKKTFSFTNVNASAEWAKGYQGEDVYIAAGLGPAFAKPSKTRTPAGRILGIPGVWADIDVNGGPENKTGAAPTLDAALEVANCALPPSIIVNSGYGIQAWWLFEEPWLFHGDGSEHQRNQAANIVRSYQAALRDFSRQQGFNIDSTHDLARLMRMPGTVNCKGLDPVPVEVVALEGNRYSIDAFVEVAREHMDNLELAIAKSNGIGVDIELRGDAAVPPIIKIEELKKISHEFHEAWDYGRIPGRPGRPKDRSPSEWDMSIANHLALASFTEQEICDAITYNRIRHNDPKQKYLRPDYMKTTIGKAMAKCYRDAEEDRQETERADAIATLSDSATLGISSPVKTMSSFSKVIGGPEVKRLIQDGIDPTNAQYRVELADGREVPLGDVRGLLELQRFRANYAVVTQHIVPNIKGAEWHKAIQALLMAAEVNDEDSRVAIVHGWLDGYLEGALSSDKEAACQVHDPFEHEGDVYIAAGTFADWLRRIKSVRMKDSEVCQYLHAAGFERKGVNFQKDNGTKSQRSYWVSPKDGLPFM